MYTHIYMYIYIYVIQPRYDGALCLHCTALALPAPRAVQRYMTTRILALRLGVLLR